MHTINTMGEARIDFRILNHSVTCFRSLDTHSFLFSKVCDSVRSHLGSAVPRRGQHRFIGTCTYTTHGHGVSWREEDSVGNRICGGRRRHGCGIEDVYDVMTA